MQAKHEAAWAEKEIAVAKAVTSNLMELRIALILQELGAQTLESCLPF